jgi:hypothetical protein
MTFIKKFFAGESGAVTVDWVVLTAAVVGLAIAAYTSIDTNTLSLGDAAAAAISGEVGQ